MEAKSFNLRDLRWAQKEGRQQGIEDALLLIEAGATTAYVREHLLSDKDPRDE